MTLQAELVQVNKRSNSLIRQEASVNKVIDSIERLQNNLYDRHTNNDAICDQLYGESSIWLYCVAQWQLLIIDTLTTRAHIRLKAVRLWQTSLNRKRQQLAVKMASIYDRYPDYGTQEDRDYITSRL